MNSNLIFEGKNLIICNYNNTVNTKEELKNFLSLDFETNALKIVIFDEYLCLSKCNEDDYRTLNNYLTKIYEFNLRILALALWILKS